MSAAGKPTVASPQFENIPQELRRLKQWLLWRYVPKKGKPGEFDKVPFYAHGAPREGAQGSPEDRAALATFEDVRAEFERGGHDGVGLAMLKEAKLVGLDLDDVIDSVGDDAPILNEVLTACDSYSETSPSGHGVRVFYFGEMRDDKNAHRAGGGIEVFCSKGYLTVTGARINGSAIVPLPSELKVKFEAWLTDKPKRKKSQASRAGRKLTLEQVAQALDHVDADDREIWLKVCLILGRDFNVSDEAWELCERWAARSPKFDEDRAGNLKRMREMFYRESQKAPPRGGEALTLGTLIHWAQEGEWVLPQQDDADYEKFIGVRPANKFLYRPSGALWSKEAIDATLAPRLIGYKANGDPAFQRASDHLMKNCGVNSMTYDPALPEIVEDKVAREQGIVEDKGARLYNTYAPPRITLGDMGRAQSWLDHVHKLLPKAAEAEHIVRWCAHRVQRPGEKVRHAIVIAGPQGIGKDTIFEAIAPAIGAWNCDEIKPNDLFGDFNEHVRTVLLRISEVVDLHEISQFKFNEATKTLIAGNPEFIRVNPKYGTQYHVRNVCGVVMTTNHGTGGLYLPEDDRRHYVVETVELWGTAQERADYFNKLYAWLFSEGGCAHVAAYLHSVDLNDFDPNAPPPHTESWEKIVASSLGRDGWLIDGLEQLREGEGEAKDFPRMVRADVLRELCVKGDLSGAEFNARLALAMARAGYELLPNMASRDRRHNLEDANSKRVRCAVYVRRGTPRAELPGLLERIRRGAF